MTGPGTLPIVRRHPFLGLLAGLILGSGVSLGLVLYGVIAVGTWPPLLLPPILALAGGAWGWWGPVRGSRATVVHEVPTYNARVQQALADNESAIESASGSPTHREPTTLLPGIGPPSADDNIDWHRPDDDAGRRPDSDQIG